MSDYDKIARAIEFIRANVGSQPSLAKIAAEVHLSEYHFQRLFSRWAGVTPKRYLQALTLERAKQLLQQPGMSSLNASHDLGLSSGSRLYDHFVQIEAVTPSQYRSKGHGLTISYGYHQTAYGLVFVARTSRGVCQLDFIEPQDKKGPLRQLARNWSNARIIKDMTQTNSLIDSLLSPKAANATPLSLWVRGTNFQLNVWRALLKIPAGKVVSYSDIAQAIGKPGAARAVGTAVGSNPVGLIIPCHRVLRQTGELGGYRWGTTRKHAILARESAPFE